MFQAFGSDLLGRLANGKGENNILISPLSVSSCLARSTACSLFFLGNGSGGRPFIVAPQAMVAVGATPASPGAEGLTQALRTDLDAPGAAEARQAAVANLTAGGGDGVRLVQANSLWARASIRPEFADRVQATFGADVRPLAGAAPINAWVADKTEGKIASIVDDMTASNPQTSAILVNAVYFKGLWQSPFSPSASHVGTFRAPGAGASGVPAVMMHQTLTAHFAQLPSGAAAVALPYGKSGRFRLLLALPPLPGGGSVPADSAPDWEPPARSAAQPAALAAAAASLAADRAHMAELRTALAPRRVEVTLPRFTMQDGAAGPRDLGPVLQAMGLGPAFRSDGQFLPMSADPRLRLSQVLHRAVIEVTEEGTEAAAATAAVMMTRSVQMRPPRFVADRPFVLAIEDGQSGAPLFLGLVVSPHFPGVDELRASSAAV